MSHADQLKRNAVFPFLQAIAVTRVDMRRLHLGAYYRAFDHAYGAHYPMCLLDLSTRLKKKKNGIVARQGIFPFSLYSHDIQSRPDEAKCRQLKFTLLEQNILIRISSRSGLAIYFIIGYVKH